MILNEQSQAALSSTKEKLEGQGVLSRFKERIAKREKALRLSLTAPVGVKSDHIGPNFHRVNVGWENQIHWSSYWMKAQQPVCAWNLKTSA